jgi:hypothetical protein
MGEWVMAVEEVKIHNDRLEEGARLQYKAQCASVKRNNQRRAAAAERLHAVEKAAVETHNAGVKFLLPYLEAAEHELRKVTISLEVLRESMVQGTLRLPAAEDEEVKKVKKLETVKKAVVARPWPASRVEGQEIVMIKGDGREGRIGLSKTLVPPVCLTQLLQVVAGETFESIKRMHHQHVTAHVTAPLNFPSTHAPPLETRASQRARSLPPGRRIHSDYLHWLSAEDCHPVPSGVSSSGLCGGGSGAARPSSWRGESRPHGYKWSNDAPLEREALILKRTRNRVT